MGVLYLSNAPVACLTLALPAPGSSPAGIGAVCLAAMVFGAAMFVIPWNHLPRWAPLAPGCAAVGFIVAYHLVSGAPGPAYAVFYLSVSTWIGLTQPRGVALALTPLFAAGYLGPLLILHAPPHALWSAIVAVPVTVLLGETVAWVTSKLDIAHRLLSERELASAVQARQDPLTGLGNRRALYEWLAARASEQCGVGVVFLDLNGFKAINDTWGHAAGDEVLREVALRLPALDGVEGLSARIGGDEFVIAVRASTPTAVEAVRTQVANALAASVSAAGQVFIVSGSIGVAHDPALRDPDQLLGVADREMYDAKRSAGRDYRSVLRS